ncbi:MAG: recombinase family protein [Deltaproteobacteria bacterium]|nr:recombinase family protein [Deltaproteobacteria bacterium]
MSVSNDILAALNAQGPMTLQQLYEATGHKKKTLQSKLYELRQGARWPGARTASTRDWWPRRKRTTRPTTSCPPAWRTPPPPQPRETQASRTARDAPGPQAQRHPLRQPLSGDQEKFRALLQDCDVRKALDTISETFFAGDPEDMEHLVGVLEDARAYVSPLQRHLIVRYWARYIKRDVPPLLEERLSRQEGERGERQRPGSEFVEDTPSGRLLEGIIEVIDEFYSANLSQDVVRGMRESASRGFYPGSPVPYGYRRVKVQDGDVQRTRLEPDPATAPVVERMFRECLAGKGMLEITRGLNRDGLTTRTGRPWIKTTVHKILTNEACTGVLIWDRAKRRRGGNNDGLPPVRVEGAWPPIVDRETFEQVQAALHARTPRVTHSEYILSGLVRCARCGTAMIGHAVKSGKFFYYMCGNTRCRGQEVCPTRLLPKERVEEFVIDRIKHHILTEESLGGWPRWPTRTWPSCAPQSGSGWTWPRSSWPRWRTAWRSCTRPWRPGSSRAASWRPGSPLCSGSGRSCSRPGPTRRRPSVGRMRSSWSPSRSRPTSRSFGCFWRAPASWSASGSCGPLLTASRWTARR